MAIKINIGVKKTVGVAGSYSSTGSSINIESELPADLLRDDPAGFMERIASLYNVAHQAVDDDLERQRCEQPTAAERAAAAAVPAAPAGPANGRTDDERPDHTTPRRFPSSGGGGGRERARGAASGSREPARGGDREPTTGRALFGWAKEQEETGRCEDLIRQLTGWARKRGNTARMSEWSRADVRDGFEEALAILGENR